MLIGPVRSVEYGASENDPRDRGADEDEYNGEYAFDHVLTRIGTV
jgi:hypothetical protein